MFFDASYWGLFKGAEKNLSIGMGLMADLSRSEFKAVLTHEFGHVAQSAMRCGSAVWILNQMIDALLSSRSRFDERIDVWAQANSRLWLLFGSVAKRFLRFIRRLVLKRWIKLKKQIFRFPGRWNLMPTRPQAGQPASGTRFPCL